jgi:hypothetical protein
MTRRTQDFQTIRSEGGLLPPDLLRRVIDPKAKLDGTTPQDYGLPPGERLNEAITQSWNRLRKHWVDFRANAKALPPEEAGTGLTNDKWSVPLLRELGFGMLPTSVAPEIGGKTYAINRFFGATAIHLIGCGLSLDRRAAGVRGAAVANPHGLVQDFLNRSDAHLWAILSNGLRLRILRDSQAISRQSYLEFDLEAMFDGEVFSDFVLLWLTAHATRFAAREGERPETCWLEQWTKIAEEQGTRALGDLKQGVEKAREILGQGLVGHPKNTALRDALRTGTLTLTDFHGQLLRIVYRLIFLFVAEDRTLEGLPLLHPRDDADAARVARERYAAHYSAGRLREMAGAIRGSRHGDLWWQLNLVVGALSGEERFKAVREQLALPVLGSFLWSPDSTAALNAPSLAATDGAELANADLLDAIRHLAFTRQNHSLRPVDYKNLGAEELGGVYESLLALTPQVSGDGAKFTFAEFAGNERKTSGSYYTPDSLVQCLLDSALDPVVEEAIKGKSGAAAEQAILALKVCDPAVGSGHFLVGAAHRLARHLARIRATAQGEGEPSPGFYQHALRDVIGRCLYGVDINPMAAELCRVSLWLEALDPGKPLSFLDHHIRVGNSLLGTTPALIAGGLPDDAFNAIEGDDRPTCTQLKRRNRAEREGFEQRDLLGGTEHGVAADLSAVTREASKLDATADDTVDAVQRKADQFRRLVVSPEYKHAQQVADAWCAAFVWAKTPTTLSDVVTSGVIKRLSTDPGALSATQVKSVEQLSSQYQFFHWQLAFPEVFAKGGFDCVLGNPPWDSLSPDAKEFFSTYDANIRQSDAAGQTEIIERLLHSASIAALWSKSRREIFATVHLIKESGRYRLFAEGNLGKGDFNIYRMFVETAFATSRQGGAVAQFVPEGMYKGANAVAIRKAALLEHGWHWLIGFVNTGGVWFSAVHPQFEFCLYVVRNEPRRDSIRSAFRVSSAERLRTAVADPLTIPVSLIQEFAPDTYAIMEFANQRDIDICRTIYESHAPFGSEIEGMPRRVYMREVDMGSDRALFVSGDEAGWPVIEGRMLDCYDYRAKGYVGGRGRSADWLPMRFGDDSKSLLPQWRIPIERLPGKLLTRTRQYRVGFCDVVNPATEKCLVASMIPPETVCGHSVPTICFENGGIAYSLLWIGLANTLTVDFVARKKVRLHMTYTVVDSIPFPRTADVCGVYREIARRVLLLNGAGPEMSGLREEGCRDLGLPADEMTPVINQERRAEIQAEIEVLTARDVYGLSRQDLLYVLDPANILGDSCEVETFRVLRDRERREYGEYRTQRLVLDAWGRLEPTDREH